jgi:hypothetical protein
MSKTIESVLFVKGGGRSRMVLGVFRTPKTIDSVLLEKSEAEQSGFGCVSDPKNIKIRFARIPKTPDSVLLGKEGIGAERI